MRAPRGSRPCAPGLARGSACKRDRSAVCSRAWKATRQREKEALRALREAFSRVVRRAWVTETPGLLSDAEAVLRAAGGPIEHVKMSGTPAGERMSRYQLPGVCKRSLDSLGPDHAVSSRLRSMLYLIGEKRA